MEGPFGARKPHEPSRMVMHGRVTVDDVLAALVGRGPRIESNLGGQITQLQSARYAAKAATSDVPEYRWTGLASARDVGGVSMAKAPIVSDPWAAMDRAEHAIGKDIGVIRCLDDLEKVRFASGGRGAKLGALIALHAGVQTSQGMLVVALLRVYHERALYSKERALAEVYALARRLRGGSANAETIAQEFRAGKAADARKLASRLYGDALLALGEHVRVWNRRKYAETFS